MATRLDEALDPASQSKQPRYRIVSGVATWYNLNNLTASGAWFDPTGLTAAMTKEKVNLGTDVIVVPKDDPERTVVVTVNDRGPFLRGPDGRAKIPREPDPRNVIDLTKEAFTRLAGSPERGVVPVDVYIPLAPAEDNAR
jgi:rare lipoprotein A (peptidoglycan hydrolase)